MPDPQPPPLVPVEVIREPPKQKPEPRQLSPIHPAAAAILLFVDNLWNFADWAVVTLVLTVPLSFLSVFVPTLILQRASRRDPWMRAIGKAMLLGVIAAVPTSITGTPVGMALLAWAGIEKWRK